MRTPAAGARPGTTETEPIFFGLVEPDIALFGFDIDPADARGDPGWFFVLQEHPSEPRFGLEPRRGHRVRRAAEQLAGARAGTHLAASAADLAALPTST